MNLKIYFGNEILYKPEIYLCFMTRVTESDEFLILKIENDIFT